MISAFSMKCLKGLLRTLASIGCISSFLNLNLCVLSNPSAMKVTSALCDDFP